MPNKQQAIAWTNGYYLLSLEIQIQIQMNTFEFEFELSEWTHFSELWTKLKDYSQVYVGGFSARKT